MVGWILAIILFVIAVSACCSSDSGSSNSNTPKRNTTTRNTYNHHRNEYSYCECPSCGSPYYDGYCEECGYPDINQGWLGENY